LAWNNPLKEKEIDNNKVICCFILKRFALKNINDLRISQFKPDEQHRPLNKISLSEAAHENDRRLQTESSHGRRWSG
jgi:hypothetical protein